MTDPRTRFLLEMLGLDPEDAPEPIPPTEEEIRQYVRDLLDKDKADLAARTLSKWPDQALGQLRDAFKDLEFLETLFKSGDLIRPVVELSLLVTLLEGGYCKRELMQ